MSTNRKRKLPLIMIADADEEERALMRAILKLVGFDVVEALDGHQVVKVAKQRLPDLLVIDMALSSLDGIAGVDRIREKSALPDLPIVAVSTEETQPRFHRSKPSTVFLHKPIEYRQFYTFIDRFLPGRMTALARSKYLAL